jgi:hypothetical protein
MVQSVGSVKYANFLLDLTGHLTVRLRREWAIEERVLALLELDQV